MPSAAPVMLPSTSASATTAAAPNDTVRTTAAVAPKPSPAATAKLISYAAAATLYVARAKTVAQPIPATTPSPFAFDFVSSMTGGSSPAPAWISGRLHASDSQDTVNGVLATSSGSGPL